jgi:hypothetical protein
MPNAQAEGVERKDVVNLGVQECFERRRCPVGTRSISVHECPSSGGLIMEQMPLSLQPHEILFVKAVEPSHVVVDIWRVLYRARYLSDHANPSASALHPGDQLIVTDVSSEAVTPVERLDRQGKRDGCRYELSEYQAVPQQASPEKRRNVWP